MGPARLSQLVIVISIGLASLLPAVASASGFNAGGYPATVSGQLEGGAAVLTLEAGQKLTCEELTLSGSLGAASESLNLSPVFTKCIAFGFLGTTVNMEGCQFILRAGKETAANEFAGNADISCGAGRSIKIATQTCAVEIGPQSELTEMRYLNHTGASPTNVTAVANLGGIGYTVTKDGLLCPLNGTGVKAGGIFTSAELMTATGGAKKVSLQVTP